MSVKQSAAKIGLKSAKRAPAKKQIAKGGLKLGKRKAIRTPAGTAALYGQALVGNDQARSELKDAFAAARKAYDRSSDRRGRPDIGALIEDRKARREVSSALVSVQQALRIAGRKRSKPKSAKGPTIALIAVAGAGTVLVVNKELRAKVLGTFGGSDEADEDITTGAPNGAATPATA